MIMSPVSQLVYWRCLKLSDKVQWHVIRTNATAFSDRTCRSRLQATVLLIPVMPILRTNARDGLPLATTFAIWT